MASGTVVLIEISRAMIEGTRNEVTRGMADRTILGRFQMAHVR